MKFKKGDKVRIVAVLPESSQGKIKHIGKTFRIKSISAGHALYFYSLDGVYYNWADCELAKAHIEIDKDGNIW